MSHVIDVRTSQGLGRMVVDGPVDSPEFLLVLGHGAGGGIEAPDLTELAERLPAVPDGPVTVARFEQPWRRAGRRVAVAPKKLDEAMTEALPQLFGALSPRTVVLGGRSAGARVACRTAKQLGAAGVLALAFPLHPPGHPERSRADELLGAGLPTLVVQGERDPFGGTDEAAEAIAGHPDIELVGIKEARHELVLPKRTTQDREEVWAELAARVAAFVRGTTGE